MVKALVATSVTQGFRDNDYHWCVDGELVWIAPTCSKDRDDPDGGCGCGRGSSSGTAVVISTAVFLTSSRSAP